MKVKLVHSFDDESLRVFKSLARGLETLGALQMREFEAMSAAMDRLTREVTETRELGASAVAMIEGLAEQIRDLKDDPAALEALADELDATQTALAAAISANTPQDTTGGGEDTVSGGGGEDTIPAA
jgi:hypothetical protein